MMSRAFVVEEAGSDCTRLIVRARGGSDYKPPFGVPAWTATTLMPPIHYIMQQKQLLEIARRVEGDDRGSGHDNRRSTRALARGRRADLSSARVAP